MINSARAHAGLQNLKLGANESAQLQAEAMLQHCFVSHWGIDGTKPYMRYSADGDYQVTSSVWTGNRYCFGPTDEYPKIEDIRERAIKTVERWLDASRADETVLSPRYVKVHIGLAWDDYNFRAYTFYEGDYVEFTEPPTIEQGQLTFAGHVKTNRVALTSKDDLAIHVYRDTLPRPLTVGQLIRTTCYDHGLHVASLRPPPKKNHRYVNHDFSSKYDECPNPYRIERQASVPKSVEEATKIRDELTPSTPMIRIARPIKVNLVTAEQWSVAKGKFRVSADLTTILKRYGSGVYSIRLWGKDFAISHYPIVHRP